MILNLQRFSVIGIQNCLIWRQNCNPGVLHLFILYAIFVVVTLILMLMTRTLYKAVHTTTREKPGWLPLLLCLCFRSVSSRSDTNSIFSACFLHKIIDLPGGQINDPSSGKHYRAVACFWPPVSRIWHTLAVLSCLMGIIWGLNRICSCQVLPFDSSLP